MAGGLDDVVIGEDGRITGKKVWWVAHDDLGRGPYRWLVTQGKGGRVIATRGLFYLPGAAGETVRVEVSLAP